jgi:3',5'-cyclic AMP phosphodiesterase CpdA
VVVSDSHLSARVADTGRNWSAALRYMQAAEPDFVIHVGDLCMDAIHDPQDLVYGRAQMDRVPAPWRAVPGNHDIGDAPSASIDPGEVVNPERVARWCDQICPDHWAIDLGAWHLVGVNAQLFGTGLPAEEDQWAFLEDELVRTNGAERQRVLVVHKPVAASDRELAAAPHYRFVPAPARDRLWKQVKQGGVGAVLSGHVHQSRVLQLDGVTQLWAPTTWAVLPDSMQGTIGSKRCGLLQLELHDDGPPTYEVVEPQGMAQLVISGGVPHPSPR